MPIPTDISLVTFSDIKGNEIDLSSSENYKSHAYAEHACVHAILTQFHNDFYYYLRIKKNLIL